MDGSGFEMRLGMESALRRALPYGGLPGNDSPQMAFFNAATDGDLRRLRELASGKDAEEMEWLVDVAIQELGPFQAAARLGRVDVCRYMVEELGFDINAAGSASKIGVTALSAAAIDGKMAVVRYLLDHGADPNKKDFQGSVPLHYAAIYGQAEATRLLISRGANVEIANCDGTPIHTAAAHGNPDVIKVLLEHHADANKVSEVSGTPLTAALNAVHIASPESILLCVKLLVEAGADVNSANPDTPLVLATTHGLTECIEYLLKAGAEHNIPTSHHEHSYNKDQLKLWGNEAFQRMDYCGAAMLYTKAIELDPNDEKLYSNRSLCYLEMGQAGMALLDANACIERRPAWAKGYYRKGVALMFLKKYKEACDVFMAGLKLDPGNPEMKKKSREAIDAMERAARFSEA